MFRTKGNTSWIIVSDDFFKGNKVFRLSSLLWAGTERNRWNFNLFQPAVQPIGNAHWIASFFGSWIVLHYHDKASSQSSQDHRFGDELYRHERKNRPRLIDRNEKGERPLDARGEKRKSVSDTHFAFGMHYKIWLPRFLRSWLVPFRPGHFFCLFRSSSQCFDSPKNSAMQKSVGIKLKLYCH